MTTACPVFRRLTTTTFLCGFSMQLALSGCGNDGPGSTTSPAAGSTDNPPAAGSTDNPPAAGSTDNPPAASQRMSLTNSIAIGVGEFETNPSLQLGADLFGFSLFGTEKTKKLVKVTTEGKIEKLELPKTEVVANESESLPNVYQVINLEKHGVAVVLERFSTKLCSQLLWIKKDGTITSLGDQFSKRSSTGYCEESFSINEATYTTDGKVWVRAHLSNSSGVFKFDLVAGTASRITDEQQNIEAFRATSDGSVFISGRLIATNASFSRRIKPNNGFENFSCSYFQGSGVAGTRLLDGNKMWEISGGKLTRSTLPIDITSGNGSGQRGFRTVGNDWFLAAASGTALSVAENAAKATNPASILEGRPLTAGVFFDGSNLAKLSVTSEGVRVMRYATLIYENAGADNVQAVLGPYQGLSEGTYQLLTGPLNYGPSFGSLDAAFDSSTASIQVALSDALSLVSGTQMGITNTNAKFRKQNQLYVSNGFNGSFYEADLAAVGGTSTFSILNPTPTNLTWESMVQANNGKAYYGYGGSFAYEFNMTTKQTTQLSFLDGNDYITSINTGRDEKPVVISSFGSSPNQQLCINWFDSWSFSTYAKRLCTAEFSPASDRGRYFAAYPSVQGDPMAEFLLLEGSAKLLPIKADRSGFDAAISVSSIPTSGYFLFGQTMSAREIVEPWTTTDFLLSGIKNSQYRSYRVSTITRQETRIPDLDGIQVYTAGATADESLIVNGLSVDDNARVTLRFSPDGTLLSKESTSNVKLLDLIPFASNNP